jgi:arylsulfatase
MQRQGKWVFPGPISHISAMSIPPVNLRPFRMNAALDLPTGRETGPVFALGGELGGMGLYLKNGVPTFVLRGLDGSASTVAASGPLKPGPAQVQVDFIQKTLPPLKPQDIKIVIRSNGAEVASKTVRAAMPRMYGVAQTFDIGTDTGSTLTKDYATSVPFPGTVGPVSFDFNMQ